jgi:hypothetical protein
VKTLFIEKGSLWENSDIESFNGKMSDELLDREIFTNLEEGKVPSRIDIQSDIIPSISSVFRLWDISIIGFAR